MRSGTLKPTGFLLVISRKVKFVFWACIHCHLASKILERQETVSKRRLFYCSSPSFLDDFFPWPDLDFLPFFFGGSSSSSLDEVSKARFERSALGRCASSRFGSLSTCDAWNAVRAWRSMSRVRMNALALSAAVCAVARMNFLKLK